MGRADKKTNISACTEDILGLRTDCIGRKTAAIHAFPASAIPLFKIFREARLIGGRGCFSIWICSEKLVYCHQLQKTGPGSRAFLRVVRGWRIDKGTLVEKKQWTRR